MRRRLRRRGPRLWRRKWSSRSDFVQRGRSIFSLLKFAFKLIISLESSLVLCSPIIVIRIYWEIRPNIITVVRSSPLLIKRLWRLCRHHCWWRESSFLWWIPLLLLLLLDRLLWWCTLLILHLFHLRRNRLWNIC